MAAKTHDEVIDILNEVYGERLQLLFRWMLGICCKRHDRRYALHKTKKNADIAFRRCIAKEATVCMRLPFNILLSYIMYVGVRVPVITWYFYIKANRDKYHDEYNETLQGEN